MQCPAQNEPIATRHLCILSHAMVGSFASVILQYASGMSTIELFMDNCAWILDFS